MHFNTPIKTPITIDRSVMTEEEDGMMGIAIRLAACATVLLLWLTPWGVRGAEAEPSESCRNLAARFAVAPEQLDLKELATLGSCLTTEIGERVWATGPSAAPREETRVPPAPQGEASPPPASREGTSPPPARQYGDWPPSAPWSEHWPSPNPW